MPIKNGAKIQRKQPPIGRLFSYTTVERICTATLLTPPRFYAIIKAERRCIYEKVSALPHHPVYGIFADFLSGELV